MPHPVNEGIGFPLPVLHPRLPALVPPSLIRPLLVPTVAAAHCLTHGRRTAPNRPLLAHPPIRSPPFPSTALRSLGFLAPSSSSRLNQHQYASVCIHARSTHIYTYATSMTIGRLSADTTVSSLQRVSDPPSYRHSRPRSPRLPHGSSLPP